VLQPNQHSATLHGHRAQEEGHSGTEKNTRQAVCRKSNYLRNVNEPTDISQASFIWRN
jgi:hypothetical protein